MTEHATKLSTKKIIDTTDSFEKGDIRNLADSLVELKDGTSEMKNVGLKFAHFVRALEEIIPAGFDTTATTMRWILLCLVKLPHVQKKLFEEILVTAHLVSMTNKQCPTRKQSSSKV